MASSRRIVNISKPGYYLKLRSAEKAVEACSAIWVEYGVSIRDLTLAESIAARNEQARLSEPLALAELHGLSYAPPEYAAQSNRQSLILVRHANAMCRAA